MGANQSSQDVGSGGSSQRITVVHPSPDNSEEQNKISLPARVPPILSIHGSNIDSSRHSAKDRLDPQQWVDFVNVIHKFSSARAEIVASRQSDVQEKISQVDEYVQKFTDLYIHVKHKSLAKMNDDSRKMDDLNNLIEKYTIQSRICVDMLNKLNFLLPQELRLETFEMPEVEEEDEEEEEEAESEHVSSGHIPQEINLDS